MDESYRGDEVFDLFKDRAIKSANEYYFPYKSALELVDYCREHHIFIVGIEVFHRIGEKHWKPLLEYILDYSEGLDTSWKAFCSQGFLDSFPYLKREYEKDWSAYCEDCYDDSQDFISSVESKEICYYNFVLVFEDEFESGPEWVILSGTHSYRISYSTEYKVLRV